MKGRNLLVIIPSIALLVFAGWCCYRIYKLSDEHARIREEYTLVNNIGRGLLSVEQWRDHFIDVAEVQIDSFDLNQNQRDSLREKIEKLLHRVIADAADTILHEKKKKIGEKIKKAIANIFIEEEQFHNMVPALSETIVETALSEDVKETVKKIAVDKLNEMGETTYDSSKKEFKADSIMAKYDVHDRKEFNAMADQRSELLKGKTYRLTYIALGIVALFAVSWWPVRKWTNAGPTFFIISVVLAIEVLLVGLTSQMIELDARIQQVDFYLIGTPITFENQVIFFRSKSIVDVVVLLIKTGKYDSILVGFLILLFSIVFPLTKLGSGIVVLLTSKWRKNKFVHFFAYNSGKWSMADVMVIAIFMAYIGFKGILDDQLKDLNVSTDTLRSISTSETSLQPGYILFIGFVLFSLFLSQMLKKMVDKEPT